MDQDMTTNFTLTLSVVWKVSCNNVEAVIQTVTSSDYCFSSKSTDCVEKK